MHWTNHLWLGIGLLAQAFFSARFLAQWLLSEKARRSLIPTHFWYLSVAGAALLLAYAVHRRDPVIITGQLIGLAIYLRNLQFIHREKGTGRGVGWYLPWLGLVLVCGGIGYELGPDSASRPVILDDFWTVFGFVGQMLFTGRFLVQWWFSERATRSVTPTAFWYLSISGSLMLLLYAIAVQDPVIILGQALGVVIYGRNLWLIRLARDKADAADMPASR